MRACLRPQHPAGAPHYRRNPTSEAFLGATGTTYYLIWYLSCGLCPRMQMFLCAQTSQRFGEVCPLPRRSRWWGRGSVGCRSGFICVAFLEQAVWVKANTPGSEIMGLRSGNAAKHGKIKKKKKCWKRCRQWWVPFIVSLHLFIYLSGGECAGWWPSSQTGKASSALVLPACVFRGKNTTWSGRIPHRRGTNVQMSA